MNLIKQADIQTINRIATRGITVVHDAVPGEVCDSIVTQIDTKFSAEDWIHVKGTAPAEDNPGAPYPPEIMDEGGWYQYRFLNSYDLITRVPEVMRIYLGLLPFVRSAFGEEAIPSPYPKSQVLAIDYQNEGDSQGYHRDTQPITVGLYLTTADSGNTEGQDFTGTTVQVPPTKGSLLLMRGRHVAHCSNPIEKVGDRKVFLPLNYYTLNDLWRPESLDSEEYWG